MEISRLINLSDYYCTEEAPLLKNLSGASMYKREVVSDIEASLYEPVICLILQGSKIVSIGEQSVEVHPGDALLVSHDLPVVSRVTKASIQEPYLAAILSLDLGLLRGLYQQVSESLQPSAHTRSLSVAPADKTWLEPLGKYFALIDKPLDAEVLGPSILLEIHYRLLLSPIGGMLRNLLSIDSHASRITNAISHIRKGYNTSLSIPELAKICGMSPSSFHEHFKSVTGTTPLQYQKDLRLMEAQNLLADKTLSVSTAAYSVGYESPTHFSRDYSRKFGIPPSKGFSTSVSTR